MENVWKGYITSGLGLAIMICVFIHFFGVYEFPNPTGMSKNMESGVAFLIGLILFLVPAGKIEGMLEKKAGDIIDKTGK